MASQEYAVLLEKIQARDAFENSSIETWREDFVRNTRNFAPPKGTQITPVSANGVLAEWVVPESVDQTKTLLYLHGGGYAMGSLDTHRHLVALFAGAAGVRALSVDYRLGPEHKFPAAIDDVVAAYQWLLSQGVEARQIVISGDSAGGGLSVATLLALRDAGTPLPAGVACISPWADLEGTGESMKSKDNAPQFEHLKLMADWYLGDHDPRNPLASPIYADLTGLPPMLIHIGDADTLLDDSTRLADKARADGVEVELEVWEEMIHVWHFYAQMIPEGHQAVQKVGAFIRDRLS